MAGFGFGFGSYKNNATRMIALLQGSTIAKVSPAQQWNGSAGSGFAAIPADPVRTAAKPVMRLMVPPNQYFSDELLIGVMAGANDHGSLYVNLGLKQVVIHYEGTSTAIRSPSFQSFADVNGKYRTYFGWWAILRNDGRHGHAQVYFEAMPSDATMQSRVIGPYQFSPQPAQHDANLTVGASGSGDFQTVGAALDHCRTQAFGNPLVRIVEPGSYDVADSGQAYQSEGYCTITADVANVRIAKASYTNDTAAALRSRFAGLRFKGLNLALDMRFISEIYSETGASRLHWLDGCAVINSAGPGALWRGTTRPNSWLVRDGGWFTECYVENCSDAFVQAKLVRGTTEIDGTGELYAGAAAVVGNVSTGHRNDLVLGSDIPALTVRYTGAAASATIELAGANLAATRTITVKIAGNSDRTFVLDKSEAGYAADTHYTLQNVVAWLNGIPGITANLLDATSGRAGIWLSTAGQRGAAFVARDIKAAAITLVTHIDTPSNWWRDAGLTDNILLWRNQAINLVANDFNFDSWTPKSDVLIADNAIHNDKTSLASAAMSSQFDGAHSHVVFAHNTMSTQGILLKSNASYVASGFDLIANNSVKSIAWGSTPAATQIVNNHIHAGQTVPASASGRSNVMGTTIGGDDTTLYFADSAGDFRAIGLLANNLAPSVLAIRREGEPIASMDIKGADKIASSGTIASPPTIRSARIYGDALVLTFDDNLDESSIPPLADFTVVVAGSTVPVSLVGIVNANVTLTLTNPVISGQIVSLTYTPGGIPLRNVDFENAAGFSDQAVSNATAMSPPVAQWALLDGDTIILAFDDVLDAASVPIGSDFIVTIAGVPVSVMAATISATNVTLTLATAAIFGQPAAISYTPGANPLRNAVGEGTAPFSGLAVANSTTASPPVVQSASVDGNLIVIGFDDVLDASSVPGGGDFSVTVAGAQVSLVGVAINSTNLSITLASPVISGQSVSVAFAPGVNPLRNTAGEAVPAFGGQAVVNTTASSPPVIQSAIVNANTIVITFDDALDPAGQPAGSDFAVTIAGSPVSVTGVAINSTNLSLTLASVAIFGQPVALAYTPGAIPLRNVAGENAAAFSGRVVTNTTQASPPVVQSASVNGRAMSIVFDDPLDAASIPAGSDFVVTVAGSSVAVSSVAINATNLLLTLASPVTFGQSVSVAYTPGANRLRNSSGENSAAFTGQAVANTTLASAPVIQSARVNGDALDLTYDLALDETSIPATGDFLVRVNGSPRAVGSVNVLGNQALLTLAAVLIGGETVTIGYTPGSAPIRSVNLANAASLVGLAVTNNTAASVNVTNVTQYGITWSFDKPYPVGRYANGDWWVNGGGSQVGITSITPASRTVSGTFQDGFAYSGRTVHGAEVNPGNRSYSGGSTAANSNLPAQGGNVSQGWDSLSTADGATGSTTVLAYAAANNVDPGRTGSTLFLTEGSVVKAVSNLNPGQYYDARSGRGCLTDMAVLTVVTSTPPAGAMRPGVAGTGKDSPYHSADIDLGVFQNLAKTASTPTAAEAASYLARMLEVSRVDSINSRNIHASNNQDEYGREVADKVHTAGICLNMNFTSAEKLPIAIGMYQLAIDLSERAAEGGIGYDAGGGNGWKHTPVVLARAMTGRATDGTPVGTYAGSPLVWTEDRQVFSVSAADVALPRYTADGRARTPYQKWHIGATDWGEKAILAPDYSGSNWDCFYRDVGGNGIYGGVLAARLTTGAEAIWNKPETFKYYLETHWWWEVVNHFTAGSNNPSRAPIPLYEEVSNAHRPAFRAPPIIVEANVHTDVVWMRHDRMLIDDNTATPAASRYTIRVNGTPRSATMLGVFRENVGLQLASAVSSSDLVTISYADGANPLKSTDGVNMATQGSPLLVTNVTPSVGGVNANYPVVRFTASNPDSLGVTGSAALDSQTQPTGSLWLPHLRIDSAPNALVKILGASSGSKPFELELRTDRSLNLILRSTSGSVATQIRSNPLSNGTDYGVLFSWNVSDTSSSTGATVQFYNWTSSTWTNGLLSTPAWNPSIDIGWTKVLLWRLGGFGTSYLEANFGGLWLDCRNRISVPTQRDRLVSQTRGSLDIGTLGDGVTGSQPNLFVMGNAAQYNDPAGINRGSGFRLFPLSGGVYDVSGAQWR